MGGASSKHERCVMHTKFWRDNLKWKDHLEHLGVDERIL
jgi:hypothetical protein